jgi:ADP-ribose pyrophosphatase YjhB (NUDIX family)
MSTRHGDNDGSFTEPQTWYAQLPAAHVAVGALITDTAGHVLLVKPGYRDHWLFPGGWAEDNEPPQAACARELTEELGVQLPITRLLVADWAPAAGQRPRPVTYYLFDGGTIPDPALIRIRSPELTAHAFLPPDLAENRLIQATAGRLPAALAARHAGTTIYLPLASHRPSQVTGPDG